MNVSLAKTAGFCFGVKRAVDMAYTEQQKENRFIPWDRSFTMKR